MKNILTLLALGFFFSINANAIACTEHGGQEVSREGETYCGYRYVETYEGEDCETTVDCWGEDDLHCGLHANSSQCTSNYNLELKLVKVQTLSLINGTLNGSYNENWVVGPTTYYGSISWSTNPLTGVTTALTNIIVTP